MDAITVIRLIDDFGKRIGVVSHSRQTLKQKGRSVKNDYDNPA
ncbi:hypothetical protein [Agrobacterium cavarae]|nr:hypothetical protein [Agrobacterium cavarae]